MTKLYHIGITVSDLERSLAFYREVIGMEVVSRNEVSGAWFDQLTDNHGARFRVAHLRQGDFVLQLVQYLAAGGERLRLGHNQVGNPHMSFYAEDVERKYAEVRGRAGQRVSPLVTIAVSGRRSFYTYDPDGVPVEFIQAPAPS